MRTGRIVGTAAISAVGLVALLALAGCPVSAVGTSPTSAKAIAAFGFPSLSAVGTITESSHTISVTVPFGTNVTALVAAFTTTGASVDVGAAVQASGTSSDDFSNPVTYTVVAADGSTQTYTVTVTVASALAYNISNITASSGTLSFSGGNWTFDAGSVPQYATETVTFTATNSGGADFVASGSQSFTPASDFSDSVGGTFTVTANSSNSFTGSFTPTSTPTALESGTLTLTPTTGSPIAIALKGTSVASFGVYVGANGSTGGSQVLNGSSYGFYGLIPASVSFSIANISSTADIKLTGSSPVSSSNADFTIGQPSTTTIAAGGSNFVTFTVTENVGLTGDTATITVQGTDTTTNAPFTFSFTVKYNGLG